MSNPDPGRLTVIIQAFRGETVVNMFQGASVGTLTCLRRGHVDHDGSPRGGTQIRHPVLALDGEAVVGIRLQVCDLHRRRREAKLSGDKVNAAATRGALAPVPKALPAVNAVGDVSSSPRVPGRGPLQRDAGLVHC